MTLTYEQRQACFWFIVGLAALLSITSFSAAFLRRKGREEFLFSRVERHRRRQQQQLLCNGHANLCDKRANEVVYATLHNANNALLDGAWFLPNHKLDLKKALNAGYRGLNMDFGECFGRLTLLHITCLLKTKAPFSEVMTEILDFVNENPREVVILPTEISPGNFFLDTPTLEDIDQAFQSVPGFKEKLYDHPGPGQPWPTLQELIDMDKRILFFFYNAIDCTKGLDCPVGFHPWFDYAAETRFSFPFSWSLNDKERSCEITRGLSGTRDFFGVNAFVTPPRLSAPLQVNRYDFLQYHIEECETRNGGLQANVVLVDYWKIGDVLRVVHDLNAAL